MPARAYPAGGAPQLEPLGPERDVPQPWIPRSLRRVASGDVATLASFRSESPHAAASPVPRGYSPLEARDLPSGSASPAAGTPGEERPLSRTATRILRLSRSFSRLGERKSSAGSAAVAALPSPTLGSATPSSMTPTPRLRSDSSSSALGGSATRLRTRNALLAARDSPDVASPVLVDELGQVQSASPVWMHGHSPIVSDGHGGLPRRADSVRGAARPGASPVGVSQPLSPAVLSPVLPDTLPDVPPPDAERGALAAGPSRLARTPAVAARRSPSPASGLGLTIEGMRLTPGDAAEWPDARRPVTPPPAAALAAEGDASPQNTSPRRQRARAFASSLKPAKWRDKPLPPVALESAPLLEESKRSNGNLRRLFKAGLTGLDDEERRPAGFRRRRSDARLVSGDAPRVSPPVDAPAPAVSVQLAPPTPAAADALPVSTSSSSASSSALAPGDGARADTPGTSPSDGAGELERKRSVQRFNVLRELAETERSYAADLAVVKGLYLAQARLYAGIKTPTTSMLAPSPHIHAGDVPPAAALPRTLSSRSTESLEARHLDAALHHPLSPPRRRDEARGSVPSVASVDVDEEGPAWAHPERATRSPMPERARAPGSPARVAPLSVTDIMVIFAGLEPCVALASEMSALLLAAVEERDAQAVGFVFLQKMAQIEQVYTLYCGRHEAAMTRLHEVTSKSPAAAAFLAECDETSREHSKAWDLPSLLIKPVQRVLKYPLFLKSIVDCTPPGHAAYPVLQQALQQIELVADRINENKKRIEIVERHGFAPLQPPRPSAFRRPPTALRKGKSSPRLPEPPLTADEGAYKAWLERLDVRERSLLAFAEHCCAWAQSVRAMYAAQLRVADEWIAVYRTGNTFGTEAAVDRLLQYRLLVQHTLLETVCDRLDAELRRTVLATTHAVQRLLERPRMVMANRAAKEHEYRKYLAELVRRPTAQPGSGARTFLSMHVQLMEELPTLLHGLALVLDRCVVFFAEIQTTYYRLVTDELRVFCTRHFPLLLSPNSASTPTAAPNPLLTPVERHAEPLPDPGAPPAAPPSRPVRSEARTPHALRAAPLSAPSPPPSSPPLAPQTPSRAAPDADNTWATPHSSVHTAHSFLDEELASPERLALRDSYVPSSAGHSLFRDARASVGSISGVSLYRDASSSTDLVREVGL